MSGDSDGVDEGTPRRTVSRGVAYQNDPVVIMGCPYDEGATDAVLSVEMPALHGALASFGETITVSEARSTPEARPLTTEERRVLIDQTCLALSELYVHRYLKLTKHAFDPVAALQQLRRRCQTERMAGYDFHLEVMRILKELRDIHTGYVMPRPFSEMLALLPFTLAAYRPGDPQHLDDPKGAAPENDAALERRVIVQGMLADFKHQHFVPGVEVLSWNGMPVQQAIMQIGQEEQGANIYAQFALGLRLMTVRWLGGSLPPSEYFVTIFYRDLAGEAREIRFPWRVITDFAKRGRIASIQALQDLQALQAEQHTEEGPSPEERKLQENVAKKRLASGEALKHLGSLKGKSEAHDEEDPSVDGRTLLETHARKRLFALPGRGPKSRDGVVGYAPVQISDLPPHAFDVSIVTVRHEGGEQRFGLLHIENFFTPRDPFVAAFLRILEQMPETGLVIDLRSNPGGKVKAAETILQTLTHREITPLPFQFLATTLVEELVLSRKIAANELKPWKDKVVPSIEVGNQYSRFSTLTDRDVANAIGQRYFGPVALITDAMTYSSGDIFSAGFQDHEIGPVIGVDPTTGGGGANLWEHRLSCNYDEENGRLDPLPGGAYSGPKLRYAVRRCTRVGERRGILVEEQGVECDALHLPTREDLLERDRHLMQFVARVLREREVTGYKIQLFVDDVPVDMGARDIEVQTASDTVVLRVEITVDPALGEVSHALLVDGVARGTLESHDGRARLETICSTAAPLTLGIRSDAGERASEAGMRTIARARRQMSFVAPDPEPAVGG